MRHRKWLVERIVQTVESKFGVICKVVAKRPPQRSRSQAAPTKSPVDRGLPIVSDFVSFMVHIAASSGVAQAAIFG